MREAPGSVEKRDSMLNDAPAATPYPVSDRKLNGYYVEIESEDEPSEPHEHPGAEIIYVLRGELVVNLEGEDFTLGEGDSMYFDCTHPHSCRRKGTSPCSAVVVVTA